MPRPPSKPMAECDPSWAYYANTILVLGSGPRVMMDLRAPLSDGDRAALAAVGLRGQFAVITAANPFGHTVDGGQNRRRHSRLLTALVVRGVRWVATEGVSPDGRHREAGVAAVVTPGVAIALARRYGQSAFFWYDGSDVWLIGAAVSTEPVRLPAVR